MEIDVVWEEQKMHLEDLDLLWLPDRPICDKLVRLIMRGPSLSVIPDTFFEKMPLLKVLDLSNTNILSLPASISCLATLEEFLLKDCSALIKLPTEVRQLSKLKLFDINGTELMFIPKEVGEPKELEVLRVSLSQYAKYYIETNSVQKTVIPRNMISSLKKLKELCVIINVGEEPEWWEEEVKDLQKELCKLENLETLRWYLPTREALEEFLLLEINGVLIYEKLSNMMLTIGQHPQLTSCLPRDLEKKFQEFKNCLNWINAEGKEDAISMLMMANVEALFLSCHWTMEKLSTLNVTNLKYCLLAECNEMETVIEVDGLTREVETSMEDDEKVGFELLEYLSIHHMNKLKSIWKGPIGTESLSKLTTLGLHTCTQLTSVFTPTVAQNLLCLTELIVEDCPQVTSLISKDSHMDIHGPIFPTLDRISLLDLPVLDNIFGGLTIEHEISTLLIFSCLKLQKLSVIMELPSIKEIKGENEWWDNLDDDKSLFQNVSFERLTEGRELVQQLFEATNSLQHFHDNIKTHAYEKRAPSELTDTSDQMITPGISMKKGKGVSSPPKVYEERTTSEITYIIDQVIIADTSMEKGKGVLSPIEVYEERTTSEIKHTIDQVIIADKSMEKGKGVLSPIEEMASDVNWGAKKIRLNDDHHLHRLPDQPLCYKLVELIMWGPSLSVIPETFFKYMPVLKVLDLSYTNIKSLPISISRLTMLENFFLKDCSALIELPTEIGMLSKLKLFDISGTELMFIPKEMRKLEELEVLRVSLSQYAKHYIETKSVQKRVIPREVISVLTKLKELCVIINVGEEPEWWKEEVKYLQNELCCLKNLQTLKWNLPTQEALKEFLRLRIYVTYVPIYAKLSNMMLTIGQPPQLITSSLPCGIEKKFLEFKNCLNWISYAERNEVDISIIFARAEALFLHHHRTIKNLSTFDVSNLKYCLVAECNEMETLFGADELSTEVRTREKNDEKVGFELLEYLSIHHMNRLQSIWKGPIGKNSLSKLTILALHTCTQLTSVFTLVIAKKLLCLIELTVDDCPNVRSIIESGPQNAGGDAIFPSLDRVFLLNLPELRAITYPVIFKKLSTLLIYNCQKLGNFSSPELPSIKKIIADKRWWKNLKLSNEDEWKTIFKALENGRELVEQLSEATNSLKHFHDIISQVKDVKKQAVPLPLLDEGPSIVFDNEVTDLKKMLLADLAVHDCSVVVVSGPEASGKTTLVEKVRRDPEVQGKFGRNIYFAKISSSTYDLKVIIKHLLSVNQPPGKLHDFTTDQEAIEAWGSFLDENWSNDILLVLDDVRSDSIITNFKFYSPPGYKILVTSRKVFTQFQTYHMQYLVHESAKSPRSLVSVHLVAALRERVYQLLEAIRLMMKETPVFEPKLKTMRKLIDSMPVFVGNELDPPTYDKMRKLLEQAKCLVGQCKNFKWKFSLRRFSKSKRSSHESKLHEMNESLLLMFEEFQWRKFKDTNLKRGFEKGSSSSWSSGAPMQKAGAVIGFDDRARDLMAMVLKDSPDDDCSIVVVSAAGGFGKTTLVTMLCHYYDIQARFGRNIHFVTVSESYDPKVIITKLLGPLPSNTNNEQAIQQWGRFLGDNQSEILLVLDDVRSGSVIKDFKFKLPGYKVLVTSRTSFTEFNEFRLDLLNNQDATRLFHYSTGLEERNQDNNIPHKLVEKLVKCCKNHPLTLSVVGGMLKGTNYESWHVMLERLTGEKKSLLDPNESILETLKNSLSLFDEDYERKQLYLDLGLFPKDHKIAATTLMDIRTHYLHMDKYSKETERETMHDLTDFASKNLVTLLPKRELSYAILDNCEEHFALQHEMMREVSIRLSSQEPIKHRERLIINSYEKDLSMLPKTVNARILSISADERFPLSRIEIDAPYVEVLVLNFMLNIQPLPQFMQNMKRLRVLIITNYGYDFPEIQDFPKPNYIYFLTSIRLEHISISSIASTLLELESLERLTLVNCKIGSSFNKGLISSSLTRLLEIHIDSCDDLVTFPEMLCYSARLKKLSIINCHELTSLSDILGYLYNLEVLRLKSCSKLRTLPESVTYLEELRIIDISHCLSLCELPDDIGKLGSLMTINTTGCTGLHELPESINHSHLVKVLCDEKTSHLWRAFKKVEVVVRED